MKRESGYYWVERKGDNWQIAEYRAQDGIWEIIGYECFYVDADFSNIDERIIERQP